MDGGFFSVVAARTIGALPRLGPVRASRFEPGADLAADVVELDQEWPAAPAPRAEQQQAMPLVHAPTLSAAPAAADAPLLPTSTEMVLAEPPARVRGEHRLRPDDPTQAPADERQAELSPPVMGEPQARRVARAAEPRQRPAGYVPVDVPAPQTFDAARETLIAEPEQPSVTVRIGRIDVRAILAPPVPAPTPAPLKRAGPSLEEHLRRRDAELR